MYGLIKLQVKMKNEWLRLKSSAEIFVRRFTQGSVVVSFVSVCFKTLLLLALISDIRFCTLDKSGLRTARSLNAVSIVKSQLS